MTDTPWHVTPTDPPSSAVLIDEHRQLQIRAGAAGRVDYVFARLVFSEMPPLDGPTAHGRVEHVVVSRPYRLAVEEPPESEAGWMLLAEVTVRAGQTLVEAEDIHPPGWHHQHGADAPTSEPAPPRPSRHQPLRDQLADAFYHRSRTVAGYPPDRTLDDSIEHQYRAHARTVADAALPAVEARLEQPERELDQLSEMHVLATMYGADLRKRVKEAETITENARRVAAYWRDSAKAGDPGYDPADSALLHACATILDALTSPETGASVLADLGIATPVAEQQEDRLPDWERQLLDEQWRRDHPEDT